MGVTHAAPAGLVGQAEWLAEHTVSGLQATSEKGAANGYASLSASTKVPIAELPTGTTSTTVALGNHTHSGSEAFPVGSVFIGVVSTNPATLLGYGTWAAFGAGRVLVGIDAADTDFDTVEEVGGAKTKAISAHAGAAVADHAALTHSGAAVADHASHTHTYTQVVNHTHPQSVNSATTGGLSGYTPDTSTNTSATSGYSTGNPSGGVATGTTNSESATLTHSVTQPSNHAAQAHSVTQPSAHTDLNVVQPYIVVYMWKRTA